MNATWAGRLILLVLFALQMGCQHLSDRDDKQQNQDSDNTAPASGQWRLVVPK